MLAGRQGNEGKWCVGGWNHISIKAKSHQRPPNRDWLQEYKLTAFGFHLQQVKQRYCYCTLYDLFIRPQPLHWDLSRTATSATQVYLTHL